MSELYDNVSAEVVLREPRSLSNARKCLDGCLARLKPRERDLVLHLFQEKEKEKGPDELVASMRVSGAQLKKIRSRLEKCVENCLNESEENALR